MMTGVGRIALLSFALLLACVVGVHASTCTAHWTCSSSQCESVMGGSSGDSGPFNSASDCQAWGQQYNQDSSCTCDDDAVSAPSPDSSGGDLNLPVPSGGGLSSQQAAGVAIGAIGLAMIFEGLEEESRQDAQATAQAQAQAEAAQAEAERVQAEKSEETKRRLLGEMKGVDSTDLSLKGVGQDSDLQLKTDDEMASLPPPPAQLVKVPDPDPKKSPRTAAFLKGKTDASDCQTQNAGGYCVGLSATDTMSCVNDYHGGYALGEKAATAALMKAYSLGGDDRRARRKFGGLATGIGGMCGVHAVEAYSSGFFDRPFTAIGR